MDRPLPDQPLRVWPDEGEPDAAVGSIVVVLPPNPSPLLRWRAGHFAHALTVKHPGAGRHVAVAGRLQKLHERAAWRRRKDSDDGVFLTTGELLRYRPHFVVRPVPGQPDRFEAKAPDGSVLSVSDLQSLPGGDRTLVVALLVPSGADATQQERWARLAIDLAVHRTPPAAVYLRTEPEAPNDAEELAPPWTYVHIYDPVFTGSRPDQ